VDCLTFCLCTLNQSFAISSKVKPLCGAFINSSILSFKIAVACFLVLAVFFSIVTLTRSILSVSGSLYRSTNFTFPLGVFSDHISNLPFLWYHIGPQYSLTLLAIDYNFRTCSHIQ